MQTVIFCGGSGTRLREMSEFLPKPLIPIGGKPLVWHIMKLYAHYGFKEFILALGYKQEAFKQYFTHYDQINNDVTVDIGCYQGMNHHEHRDHGWRVTMSDTGLETLKGGRLKKIEKYVKGDDFFCTYGDGIGDIDLPGLLKFHFGHNKIATVTAVHPVPRFGEIKIDREGRAVSFSEKPEDGCLTNAGFFMFRRNIFDCLDEGCDLEVGVLDDLARNGELMVWQHKGYWGCMDSLKDMGILQNEWDTGKARWKVWK